MRGALGVVAVVLSVAAIMVSPAAAVSFSDPLADQLNTDELVAPDITSVDVTNTRDGLVTFRVATDNFQALPPRSAIVILFDLDKSLATGDQGFEHAASHVVDPAGQSRLVFERWEESLFQLVELPATNLSSSFSAGVLTLTVPRSQLGNTVGFEFGLYAAVFAEDASDPAVDSAPNDGLFAYDIVGLPPPKLRASMLTGMPGRPVAGKAFTVGTLVQRLDTGATVSSGAVTCRAGIGKLKVRAVGGFNRGRARCAVVVPRHAKGKTLRVTITIRAERATLTRTFSFRVV